MTTGRVGVNAEAAKVDKILLKTITPERSTPGLGDCLGKRSNYKICPARNQSN